MNVRRKFFVNNELIEILSNSISVFSPLVPAHMENVAPPILDVGAVGTGKCQDNVVGGRILVSNRLKSSSVGRIIEGPIYHIARRENPEIISKWRLGVAILRRVVVRLW